MEVKFNLANNWNTTAYGFSSPANGFLPATQLHFHSPSEHTINGQHFPFELHIVNQVVTSVNTTAKTASAGVPASVIAIMFKYTPDNTPNPCVSRPTPPPATAVRVLATEPGPGTPN